VEPLPDPELRPGVGLGVMLCREDPKHAMFFPMEDPLFDEAGQEALFDFAS
jgi:hypothetical protein